MPFAIPIAPGAKVDLAKIDPDQHGDFDKETALEKADDLGKELGDLIELLYGAATHSLLVVLQGRDAAGKEGSISRILKHANTQSTSVSSFKVPTAEELAHDFLWRVHACTPAKGALTIFHRSHYEDVLVVRVHELAPKEVWQARFEHINAFERLLADSGTLVVKFMLHIDQDEQEERLLDREKDPEKAWKLSVGDWKEREHWDEYTQAYEEALERCSTERAPWYVVPANRKWFRDLAIVETLVQTLRPYRDDWIARLEQVGEKARAELEAYRATIT